MVLYRLALGVLALGACAKAGNGGNGKPDAGFGSHRDGNTTYMDAPGPRPDAFVFHDAPSSSGPVTLTETADSTVAAGTALACPAGDGLGSTTDDQWYRVFQLSDYSISNALSITQVTFGVDSAQNAGTITVKIGTYSGTIDAATLNSAQISSLAMATTTVANTTTGETVMVPITATIPAGGKFVVQVDATDKTGTGNYFYLGATNGTQTHKGYLSSSVCGSTPSDTSAAPINQATHIIINVNGTH